MMPTTRPSSNSSPSTSSGRRAESTVMNPPNRQTRRPLVTAPAPGIAARVPISRNRDDTVATRQLDQFGRLPNLGYSGNQVHGTQATQPVRMEAEKSASSSEQSAHEVEAGPSVGEFLWSQLAGAQQAPSRKPRRRVMKNSPPKLNAKMSDDSAPLRLFEYDPKTMQKIYRNPNGTCDIIKVRNEASMTVEEKRVKRERKRKYEELDKDSYGQFTRPEQRPEEPSTSGSAPAPVWREEDGTVRQINQQLGREVEMLRTELEMTGAELEMTKAELERVRKERSEDDANASVDYRVRLVEADLVEKEKALNAEERANQKLRDKLRKAGEEIQRLRDFISGSPQNAPSTSSAPPSQKMEKSENDSDQAGQGSDGPSTSGTPSTNAPKRGRSRSVAGSEESPRAKRSKPEEPDEQPSTSGADPSPSTDSCARTRGHRWKME